MWHRQSEPIKNDAQQVEVHEDKLKDVLKWYNMMADGEFDRFTYCDVTYGQFYVGALKDYKPADAPPVNTTRPAD